MKNQTKKTHIAKHFRKIMQIMGLDVKNDDSLQKTPERIAKMYIDEIFYGLDQNNFPKITTQENKMGKDQIEYDQMITISDIKVHSYCEHHFIPFIGFAKVSYVPKDKIAGLSKINRIVDFYCRKPQVQEKLTMEIFNKLQEILGTRDVAVFIKAEHLCVKLRGVQDQNSYTTTCKLGGVYKDDDKARSEFLNI